MSRNQLFLITVAGYAFGTWLLIRAVKDASLDTSGLLTWTLQALDPSTGLPTTDPYQGVLPPNVTPPQGDGMVSFTISPKAGLVDGAVLSNAATIVFDDNDPIVTNTWTNTIDATPPTASVDTLLPAQAQTSFDVHWNGTDTGAGAANYTVYVAKDTEEFALWLYKTPATTATFTGVAGSIYRFYAVAEDAVGNAQTATPAAQALTIVAGDLPPPPASAVASGQPSTLATPGSLGGSAVASPGSADPHPSPAPTSSGPVPLVDSLPKPALPR